MVTQEISQKPLMETAIELVYILTGIYPAFISLARLSLWVTAIRNNYSYAHHRFMDGEYPF